MTPEQIVMNQYDAFLPSESLDPAWVAGWHSAINHAAVALRRDAERVISPATTDGGEPS